MAQHKLYLQLKTNFTSSLKNSYTKLRIHTMFHPLHLLIFLILTILGAEYKLRNSSLRYFIHYSYIFSFVTLHLNPGLLKKLQGTLWAWYRLPANVL